MFRYLGIVGTLFISILALADKSNFPTYYEFNNGNRVYYSTQEGVLFQRKGQSTPTPLILTVGKFVEITQPTTEPFEWQVSPSGKIAFFITTNEVIGVNEEGKWLPVLSLSEVAYDESGAQVGVQSEIVTAENQSYKLIKYFGRDHAAHAIIFRETQLESPFSIISFGQEIGEIALSAEGNNTLGVRMPLDEAGGAEKLVFFAKDFNLGAQAFEVYEQEINPARIYNREFFQEAYLEKPRTPLTSSQKSKIRKQLKDLKSTVVNNKLDYASMGVIASDDLNSIIQFFEDKQPQSRLKEKIVEYLPITTTEDMDLWIEDMRRLRQAIDLHGLFLLVPRGRFSQELYYFRPGGSKSLQLAVQDCSVFYWVQQR